MNYLLKRNMNPKSFFIDVMNKIADKNMYIFILFIKIAMCIKWVF